MGLIPWYLNPAIAVLILCGMHFCLHEVIAASPSATPGISKSSTNDQSFQWKDKWLGQTDPSSFSNADDFQTKAISLKWNVDFEEKVIAGSATYDFLVQNPNASILILDTRDITVKQVSSGNGTELGFIVGPTVSSFGEPLKLDVAELVVATGSGNIMRIAIQYTTSSNSTGLQWLDSLQTAGKKHPYVFSQCEAIHARSLVPCQDTPSIKFTYNAEVSVPKELQALMGALHVGEPRLDGNNKIYTFQQNISIPSYLIAIAVGDIVSRVIGPRSRVWSERELVDAAANEFDNTEALLKAAENLFGEYVWGVYDILVLPPSFPYGGMENPCLTFVSPTIIVGDKSASNSLIAHEIAHSWIGNLVTEKNWEHIWLNEGVANYAEARILGVLFGEDLRQFESLKAWNELAQYIEGKRENDSNTRLVLDLNGVDPHDAHSLAPVTKGAILVYYLEETVGGTSILDPYLRHYIQSNSYKSIDTHDFKSGFINYFEAQGLGDKIVHVDWNAWIFSTGMPPVKPEYDTKLAQACTDLKNRWIEWDPSTPSPFEMSDLDSMLPAQIEFFLQELLGNNTLPQAKVEAMENAYKMASRKNSDIRVKWTQLCIRAKWSNILPSAFQFVNAVGRLKYVRPIYQDLYKWEEVRSQAIQNYQVNAKYMMSVVRNAIEKDLHLK